MCGQMKLSVGVVLSVAVAVSGLTVPETTEALDTRACRPGYDHFTFCDVTLSKAERVASLIAELRDDEYPALLTARAQTGGGGGSPGPSGNISRLGVPSYDWGLNCIHGVQSSCVKGKDGVTYCPVDFPNAVNLGASWNNSMWETMGRIIGVENRALYVAGATEFNSWSGQLHIGLDCWSPNINLNRDPRWGRNSEVPSEDPIFNGAFGVAITKGQQWNADETRYLQSITTLKHWAVYQLEDSDGRARFNFDAEVSNYSLSASYFPAFAAAVKEGKAKAVMCSYNEVNGVPSCGNKFLDHTLRDVWKYDGMVTSDTGALTWMYKVRDHHYVNTSEEAACLALEAHTDVASDHVYHDSLTTAVASGMCDKQLVIDALTNTLGLRFDLGLFDPVDDQPLWDIPLNTVGSNESIALAQLAAKESFVLLKNEPSRGLPFAAKQKVGVFGPHANAQKSLLGDYLGQICPDKDGAGPDWCVETPAAAVGGIASKVVVVPGCGVTSNSTSDFAAVLDAVDDIDAAVLFFGIDTTVEKETRDRIKIGLPGVQADLLLQVLQKLADQSKPAVVVLINGGGLSLGADIIDASPAILEAFYPGRWGSVPIAETIFGRNDHLGGKMPYTVYPADYIGEIKMSNMDLNDAATPGRTYRYYQGEAEWKFGAGLAFTTFDVAQHGGVDGALACGDAASAVTMSFTITNTGAVAGDNVLQVYKQPSTTTTVPGLPLIKEIVAWKRVHLAPGAATTVTFTLTASMFDVVQPNGDRVCQPEARGVVVSTGDGLADIPLTVTLSGTAAKSFTFPDM